MAYPNSVDELTNGVPADGIAASTPTGSVTYPHDDHHRALAVAVEAIETELGTDPAGESATVKARLDALDVAIAAAGGDAAWAVDLDASLPPYSHTNLGSLVGLSASPYPYLAARILDSSGSVGSISWKVPLSAGTYDFHTVFYRETYMANMACKVDGTTVGTWATQGSPGGPALLTISGVSIASSGTKTITAAKTTANSDLVYLYAVLIRRTA